MIEYKKEKINNADLDQTIETRQVFKWTVTGKEPKSNKTTVYFQRDTDIPHYDEIVSLEKQFNKETTASPVPTYIFIGITVVFMTMYLIFSWILSDDSYNVTFFFTFMVPGLVSLIIAFIFMYIRVKKIQKIIPVFLEKRRDYRIKIESLTDGNKKN